MKRLLFAAAVTAAACLVRAAPAVLGGGPSVADVADAITELDVERARDLLAKVDGDSAALAIERGRLSLYVGDCDTAAATLSALSGVKHAVPLLELAKACARATAGSVVVEDKARGLLVRIQDEGDRVLVPLLSDVAARSRDAIEQELGVVMPRPLRIDLVRDLFSLSAVSGLPLSAAETTGTVAVARWGRVNMISPRAAPGGFPWEDTMAHEITHLALSRATRDAAPLWLQEGLAKRLETRWRARQPFDAQPAPEEVAREALLSGQSIGVDKLGPSIAMLPSADAASIAFAEVASFIAFFIEASGRPALHLLLQDLKTLGSGSEDAALLSVTGYDLATWIARWQVHLRETAPASRPEHDSLAGLGGLLGESAPADGRDRARRVRAADLLFRRGAPQHAADLLRSAVASDPGSPSLRWRLGRSLIASGGEGAASATALFQGEPEAVVDGPHAGWFALKGRFLRAGGDEKGAAAAFTLALSLDPYEEDAACEGRFAPPAASGPASEPPAKVGDHADLLPNLPARRPICEAARKIPSD